MDIVNQWKSLRSHSKIYDIKIPNAIKIYAKTIKTEEMSNKSKFDLVREWASKRGLYDKGDVKTQYVKLGEEFGELGKGIIKDDKELITDSIGDMVVVLVNLAHLHGVEIEDCIDAAYDEIKNRTGSMKGGSFIKDEE